MIKSLVFNQYFRIVIFLVLYYMIGLILRLLLLSFQKTEWIEKINHLFITVLPHLFQVFFLALLSGLIFIWMPTLLGMIPTSIFTQTISFISSFSFAVLVSTIQGWLLIKGFEVIGKYHLPKINNEISEKKPINFVQSMIFFLGFILILSVFLDLFLSFLFSLLTT